MNHHLRQWLCASTIAALLVSAAPAHAFRLTGAGGKLGMVVPENDDGTLSIGGHMEFEQSGSRVHLIPGLAYWKESGVSDLNANLDLYYHLNAEGLTTPYVGAGLGIHSYRFEHFDGGNTDLGLNLFGGLRFPMESSHLFVEARYAATDVSQASVLGGVTFNVR
jgi:hypothetical protein